MKRILVSLALIALLEQGCATANGVTQGGLFSSIQGPVAVTPYPVTSTAKKGEGSQVAIFGLFSFGDASIHSACAQAGITKVQHVDYQAMNVLFGLFSSYKVIVYGE